MNKTARILPLITVAALALTLVVPILDSGNTGGPRIVVTSLGGPAFDLAEMDPVFLIAWAAVLGCAVSVWFLHSLGWWGVAAMLTSGLLGALFVRMLTDPPYLFWDDMDAQGNPVGGGEIGEPAIGALLWAIGLGALLAAAICGLMGARASRRRLIPPG